MDNKQTNKNSTLKSTANALILTGAIVTTVIQSIFILATLFIWTIPAAVIITFVWVSRSIMLKTDSKGWAIFGMVLGVFTDVFTLSGYICNFVDYSDRNNVKNEQSSDTIESTQETTDDSK